MPRFTQANFRTNLLRHCGVDLDDDGFTQAEVDMLLNRSFWELVDMFKFRAAQTKVTANTVAGTNTITVQADNDSVELVTIEDANSNQHMNLEEMSLITYENEYADRTDSRGKPSHFVRRGDTIILYPTPDAAYEVTTYYNKTLGDIIVSGVSIPKEWDEIILLGAVWRGFLQMGDYNRKRGAKEAQMELLGTKTTTEVKEKVNRPNAGIQMMRPPYR